MKEATKDVAKADDNSAGEAKKEGDKEPESSKAGEPKPSAEDKHNETTTKESESLKDDKPDADNKNATTSTAQSEKKNETTTIDNKYKQTNILGDLKADLESKHALPQHYNESVDEYLTKALQVDMIVIL